MLLRMLNSHTRGLSVILFAAAIYLVAAQGSQSLPPKHCPKAQRAAIPAADCSPVTARCLSTWQVPLRPDSTETANALLAVRAVDGSTISNDAVFSFNTAVGPRTAERGYQSGAMFKGGQLVNGLGGGVCYASTALYNAALEAGLPIVARSPHSGIVRYAPPGRDAAVATDTDLQFKNDTGSKITIRAKADENSLTVSIYGTRPPGWQVQVLTGEYRALPASQTTLQDPTMTGSEPLTAQACHDGYECTIVRKIIRDGKLARREEISHDIHPARDGLTIIPMDVPLSEPVTVEMKPQAKDSTTTIHVKSPERPATEVNATKAAVATAVLRSLLNGASSAK
jgi:hypothetical protein